MRPPMGQIDWGHLDRPIRDGMAAGKGEEVEVG